MRSKAAPPVSRPSSSSSSTVTSNSSSRAMTSSTRSRLSASRSSAKLASLVTWLASTERTSTAHFWNRSKSSLTAVSPVLEGGSRKGCSGLEAHAEAAVHRHHCPGDVAGLVGSQEPYGGGDLLGCTQSVHRHGGGQLVA